MSPIEIIAKFLLICVCGSAMLLATFAVADYGDELITKVVRRWQRAKIIVGWQDVARRHKGRVRFW